LVHAGHGDIFINPIVGEELEDRIDIAVVPSVPVAIEDGGIHDDLRSRAQGSEASLPHAGCRKKRQGWTAAASNLPRPMRLRITGLTIAIDGCGQWFTGPWYLLAGAAAARYPLAADDDQAGESAALGHRTAALRRSGSS
jgi:hypothetical protein